MDGPSILIVDDTPESLAYARFALKFLGHVITVQSAREAYEILERERVDLILLDLKMRDKDGLIMLAELKRHTDYKNIPVAITTGSTAPWDMEACMNLGAAAYFIKPWSLEEYRDMVRKVLPKEEQ